MYKRRKWLLGLKNRAVSRTANGVLQYDDYDVSEDVLSGELCEPEVPYYGDRVDFNAYLRGMRKRMDENRRMVTDEECMAYYDKWCILFMKNNALEMSKRYEQYREDRERSVFGRSMEYLKGQLRLVLRELLDCCCVNNSHTMIHDNRDSLDGFRLELADDVDDDTLRKYAFFRRFFAWNDGRYILTQKVMMARHLFLNVGDDDQERIMLYFVCFSMMEIIQSDMDDLAAGDEFRLSEIRGFDPYAVLEYVDRLKDYAPDAQMVRKRWYELMFRSNEIIRKFGKTQVQCFVDAKDDFSRVFVTMIVGKMKSNYGLYVATFAELASSLERAVPARDRAVRYMNKTYVSLHVLPSSQKVIESVLARR